MQSFTWINAKSIEEVKGALAKHGKKARIFAGGGDLTTLMKERIDTPEFVVNIGDVKDIHYIREEKDGLHIGAMTILADLAEHEAVLGRYTALAEAAGAVASPQLRNMGSIGGNLCQRPRCWYYRGAFHCYKKGGDFCFAVTGDNRYYHSILKGELCYMVHPSDTAVALLALDARITIAGPQKEKTVKAEDFFIGPRQDVLRENILQPAELITEIVVPTPPANTRSTFLKTRIRGSWDFALASVAVRCTAKNGVCQAARLALGGVAPVPLRVERAERALAGKKITRELSQQAAQLATAGARPMTMNRYKVDLTRSLVEKALLAVA
ncbi:MAG: xanthine dehydrogenase family protein subunit M [Candidatus Tectomicrobia bacterium]|nr:xanthine dehydrogenase family protein subunit M [Candidatus Tectomicrobia bacterium]